MWEAISDAEKARKRSLCHQAFASSHIIYVAESGPFENLTNVPERKLPQWQSNYPQQSLNFWAGSPRQDLRLLPTCELSLMLSFTQNTHSLPKLLSVKAQIFLGTFLNYPFLFSTRHLLLVLFSCADYALPCEVPGVITRNYNLLSEYYLNINMKVHTKFCKVLSQLFKYLIILESNT